MCCPKKSNGHSILMRGIGRPVNVIESNGIKVCPKCGQRLKMTLVAVEGGKKYWSVTPCPCAS
jgi:hypothetical protein